MPLVPMVVEQSARGERSFDIYSRLLGERVVGALDWAAGQGLPLGRQVEEAVVAHAVDQGIGAGQDGRVRGLGDRVAGVGVLEETALGRQAVEVGSAGAFLAVAAEEVRAGRVQGDEDHVPGTLRAGREGELEGQEEHGSPAGTIPA